MQNPNLWPFTIAVMATKQSTKVRLPATITDFGTTQTQHWSGLSSLRCSIQLAWISNYIHYNVWDEITYPSLNFS